MNSKVQEKELAVSLRKKGLTYREIREKVKVSKSSLSLWLKDLPLTDTEKGILKERKNKDINRWRLKVGAAHRKAKQARDALLFEEASKEFSLNVTHPLFQLGIGLYWAEGTKRTTSFAFMNSDPEMITLMITWVRTYLCVPEDEIRLRVFTHKAFSDERHEVRWSELTGVPLSRFGKTIYKTQNGLVTKKRPEYIGCVRIEIGKVTYFRKMLFWQQMLISHYKKQKVR